MCQRYYELIKYGASPFRICNTTGYIASTTTAKYVTTFRVPKRTTPSVTISCPGDTRIFSGGSYYNVGTDPSSFASTIYDTEFTATTAATISQPIGSVAWYYSSSSYATWFEVSAEL